MATLAVSQGNAGAIRPGHPLPCAFSEYSAAGVGRRAGGRLRSRLWVCFLENAGPMTEIAGPMTEIAGRTTEIAGRMN